MHVAQRPRPAPPRPAPAGASTRRPRPAPPVAPLQRVAAEGARQDPLAGLLARAVQRRAAGGPLLQRAIVAINGPSDAAPAQQVTLNCLYNLTHTRARGAAAGPAAVGAIAPPPLASHESLYILGHGNPNVIADLTPGELGDQLIAWYGTTGFRGKIKLVACSSAVKPHIFGSSYASRLSSYLASNATDTFRPKSVDGVLGVAWVHEKQGNIVAIDDSEYDEQEKAGVNVEGAFADTDPTARRRKLKQIFGKRDAVGSSVHTGKGRAKVRYYTGLPKHPPAPFSLMGALRSLIPCMPP